MSEERGSVSQETREQSASSEGEQARVGLSIILPIYEEEESIPTLIKELHRALSPLGRCYELICIDDGSGDQSYRVLSELAASDPALHLIQLRRNFGQTAAMQAGLDAARGALVAFLDADLQNDPADLPMMIQRLEEGDLDMVVGWRKDRQDRLLDRRLPSIIANRIIGAVTGVRLHDYGCSLKLLRAELAKTLRLYGEMHRFIPAIANWSGARIEEVAVNHRARQFGRSKYGLGRTVRVVLDLLVVRFMQSYLVKPMQVFGLGGLLSGLSGAGICAYLALQKLLYGAPLSERPLLLLGILLVVVGVQLISLGFVADLLARTYHESQGKPPYHIRAQKMGRGSSLKAESEHP
ncbi:MAG: glycosyltransferase family 2 protein [Myxococcota bacterium]|nr:glycosyltransferase family 2 protein [Myxococcota bacterium]